MDKDALLSEFHFILGRLVNNQRAAIPPDLLQEARALLTKAEKWREQESILMAIKHEGQATITPGNFLTVADLVKQKKVSVAGSSRGLAAFPPYTIRCGGAT